MEKRIDTISSWKSESMHTVLQWSVSVPKYQRAYSWDEDNIKDFLDDFENFFNEEYNTYLFGQMIFCKDGNTFQIIDGQQRLTTCVIFLAVMRDLAISYNVDFLDDIRNRIQDLVGRREFGEDRYHLELGKFNRTFFLRRIQHENDQYSIEGDTNRLIDNAYRQIYEKFDGILSKEDPDRRPFLIKDYIDTLSDHFYVSCVVTNDLGQAYVVFETLNSRGKDLDASDLLKNYFFSICDAEDSIVERWDRMVEDLTENNEPPTNFIKCYWNAIHFDGRFCRKKDLFRRIKSAIQRNDREKAKKVLEDLFGLCETYLSMVNPRKYNAFNDRGITKCFETLKKFKAKTYYPLVLALATRKDLYVDDVRDYLLNVESLIVRNIILGDKSPNCYETMLAEYAWDISEGEEFDRSISKISAEIYAHGKNQPIFDENEPSNDSNTKYVLSEVYNYMMREGETEVIRDSGKVQLEHIMPQNNSVWHADPDFHKRYVGRWGNLTLLKDRLNASASNERLESKRTYYSRSYIPYTRALTYVPDTGSWTAEMIRDRQDCIFDALRKRWAVYGVPGSETFVGPDNLWVKVLEEMERAGPVPIGNISERPTGRTMVQSQPAMEVHSQPAGMSSDMERLCDMICDRLCSLDRRLVVNRSSTYTSVKLPKDRSHTLAYCIPVKSSGMFRVVLYGDPGSFDDPAVIPVSDSMHYGACKSVFMVGSEDDIEHLERLARISLRYIG